MGDYYHHFLASMSGAGMHPVASPGEMMPPQIHGQPMPMSSAPMPGPYQQLGYFTGFPEPTMFNPSKTHKGRRKSGVAAAGSGTDHVKHRRTRSGCFMCRSRRVKCDETRPICERCKKGNRECVYPDAPASKASSGASSHAKDAASAENNTSSPSSNDEDDEETEPDTKLDTIPDEHEPDDARLQSSRPSAASLKSFQFRSRRHTSETSSLGETKSSSPSNSAPTPSSLTAYQYASMEFPANTGQPDWSHLPIEMQRCLAFFVENITHYHYCAPLDGDDFFKTILPGIAVRNEPLLNALVGFSAYHIALQTPNGKLEDFLKYYNRSVTLLLEFLKRKERHNIATLLTILQLATIEEYLGDWVNLMGHQKAALEILTSIFTPQTVMQSAVGRMCLNWYARFDNFVALMGGFPTDLPREWFLVVIEFSRRQTTIQPNELRWKIEEWMGLQRLITYDMSMLFARNNRGQISEKEFADEHDNITKRLIEWNEARDPALADIRFLVHDPPAVSSTRPNAIVDAFTPGILYDFPLFPVTILCAEWTSVMIMHQCQSPSIGTEALFRDLQGHAYRTAQYFETLENWSQTPKGALIITQSLISIASLFMPQDDRHHMWFRQKFALLERMGYIHPVTLRAKMAELFRDPSCIRWWLPDDDGLSPVLQNIRSFADERNVAAVTAQQENLREVKHIFEKMALHHVDRDVSMGDGEAM